MYNDSNARKEIMNDNKVNNSLKTKNEKTSFDIITCELKVLAVSML